MTIMDVHNSNIKGIRVVLLWFFSVTFMDGKGWC